MRLVERWRAVRKERRTVTLPYAGGSGCRVELTALEVDGARLICP